jgi:tRNA modification GTPase
MRRAVLRRIVDPVSGELVDEGLVLFFPGPRSYTGEDMAEFQVHGGRAVVQAALAALASNRACRLAEPGEFTRRALANGRLDLARVEGIGDLIAAETPQQRRQALAQASGALSSRVEAWRGILLAAMAQFEAAIDFSDEGDVQEQAALGKTTAPLVRLHQEITDVLADGRRGEIVRDGFVVVIAGPPNAGKSTLINALARRDVAIVSDLPGTTRDVLEVHLDLAGYPVTLLDTAGIRETTDPIEALGVQRAEVQARRADLVLWLSPAGAPQPAPEDWDVPLVTVTSQLDSCPEHMGFGLAISALTGKGLAELVALIGDHASRLLGGEPALVTRERHRLALEGAQAALLRALSALELGLSPEIPAEDLRLAARSLGQIIGTVGVEDVLNTLFGSFCIGK